MVLTFREKAILKDLYEGQPHPSDKLGGTPELATMALKFHVASGRSLSEAEIQSAIIVMRKSGELRTKNLRHEKPKPKPTWPREFDNGYVIPVMVRVYDNTLKYMIWQMLIWDIVPVSRQEIYDYTIAHPEFLNARLGVVDSTMAQKIEEIFHRLFPEFK